MSGTLWPRAIAGVYGAFALAMGVFVWAVSRQPVELVAPDTYEQGLRHQARIESEQRGRAAAGYAFDMDASARQARVQFPAAGVSGWIELYRPSDPALDRAYAIATDAEGRQIIDLADAAPGLWRLHVTWEMDNQSYRRAEVVVLP